MQFPCPALVSRDVCDYLNCFLFLSFYFRLLFKMSLRTAIGNFFFLLQDDLICLEIFPSLQLSLCYPNIVPTCPLFWTFVQWHPDEEGRVLRRGRRSYRYMWMVRLPPKSPLVIGKYLKLKMHWMSPHLPDTRAQWHSTLQSVHDHPPDNFWLTGCCSSSPLSSIQIEHCAHH